MTGAMCSFPSNSWFFPSKNEGCAKFSRIVRGNNAHFPGVLGVFNVFPGPAGGQNPGKKFGVKLDFKSK